MKQNKDILLLRLSAFVCALLLLLDLRVFSDAYKAPAPAAPAAESAEKGKAEKGGSSGDEKKDTEEESKAQDESAEKAVAAAAQSVVLGEIENRFISPYTANTSYNNVFLKNSAGIDINLKELLSDDPGFRIEKNGSPQVLIVHSHATECFMSEERDYYTSADRSRSTDNAENIVAVGEELANKLNAAGIVTLHSDRQHDNPDYNYSYTNCAETVRGYLAEYPGIKIILDMHRDAIGSAGGKVKVTAEINKKQAAQVMLVMGTGNSEVKHPDYLKNLRLAVRLQQTMEILYPGLARAISLVPYEYNQSLHPGSMLIEMGTDANTLSEVKYSAQLVGDALISLCNSLT